MAKTKTANVYCSYTRMENLDDLQPHEKNPNTHTERQIKLLAKILLEQGWRAPITVSNRSGFIVRGHGRLMAAREAGLTEAPVDYQDYDSEASEIADMIADNQIAELSSMDEDDLKDLIAELEEEEFDLDLTGFDTVALDDLFSDADEEEDDYGSGDGDAPALPDRHVCPSCGCIFYDE